LATGVGAGLGSAGADFAVVVLAVVVAVVAAAALGAAFGAAFAAADPLPRVLKYSTHAGSTLVGSFWYRSYISSTSHSLAPKDVSELPSVGWVTAVIRLFR
jgi:hypothetical protein